MQKFKYLILLLLLLDFQILCAQPEVKPDYGRSYRVATDWLADNGWIKDSLCQYNVPPDETIAIVFPELMRYSALRDKMEVTGLMVLYTRLGKDYADFSVGRFQMKPSFIQHLETDAVEYLSSKEVHRICPGLLNGKDSEHVRRKRVNSLTYVGNEVRYLALFYKICLKRFKNIHFKNATDRIRFLATAYNCGYHHTAKTIFMQMKKRRFPVFNGTHISKMNYADLALIWWKNTTQ